ncbi:hypothetical protein CAOG_02453 [Capsaspora owczarzaki ATCC 30864]|uniref:Uncharacterized protein n=1 Tax=Capsaspora owczarzaki (strain ATCC 30864) TaxID=595528 RepID=A0A0D2VMB8_CAPO3|nr:hypothetical protein CAOG_02453 [Capsaspora owczarzaki ATCC 30864]KJE91297.1 hypothetical protein CAOG_002453 [Capsaspora owczarzaki ATCC 30864]|eukprot:XP_004349203.1 hypothetical protein CAOG_02453 [Capsaspora owczarzaki ATCC 30864]
MEAFAAGLVANLIAATLQTDIGRITAERASITTTSTTTTTSAGAGDAVAGSSDAVLGAMVGGLIAAVVAASGHAAAAAVEPSLLAVQFSSQEQRAEHLDKLAGSLLDSLVDEVVDERCAAFLSSTAAFTQPETRDHELERYCSGCINDLIDDVIADAAEEAAAEYDDDLDDDADALPAPVIDAFANAYVRSMLDDIIGGTQYLSPSPQGRAILARFSATTTAPAQSSLANGNAVSAPSSSCAPSASDTAVLRGRKRGISHSIRKRMADSQVAAFANDYILALMCDVTPLVCDMMATHQLPRSLVDKVTPSTLIQAGTIEAPVPSLHLEVNDSRASDV